mmetsp:Transcript_9722/g.36075  ORF Transcript_9722/g.36075 Transcript_9722/m.36075 type:complete len:396 (+) Transcript_9722:1791-2978(+)
MRLARESATQGTPCSACSKHPMTCVCPSWPSPDTKIRHDRGRVPSAPPPLTAAAASVAAVTASSRVTPPWDSSSSSSSPPRASLASSRMGKQSAEIGRPPRPPSSSNPASRNVASAAVQFFATVFLKSLLTESPKLKNLSAARRANTSNGKRASLREINTEHTARPNTGTTRVESAEAVVLSAQLEALRREHACVVVASAVAQSEDVTLNPPPRLRAARSASSNVKRNASASLCARATSKGTSKEPLSVKSSSKVSLTVRLTEPCPTCPTCPRTCEVTYEFFACTCVSASSIEIVLPSFIANHRPIGTLTDGTSDEQSPSFVNPSSTRTESFHFFAVPAPQCCSHCLGWKMAFFGNGPAIHEAQRHAIKSPRSVFFSPTTGSEFFSLSIETDSFK